ncbi:hypothetical protein [Kosakonia phage Kc166B]|nr:hypothetical protein [Kosakonia phage Kc237]QQV88698.1 hypothetical protein [Kosakonia phage Kc166B]
MATFAYVVAAILGGSLCVMIGANVWRFLPVIELVYSVALVAGAGCGIVVLIIFTAYERRVIEPMRRAVEVAEKVATKAAEGAKR